MKTSDRDNGSIHASMTALFSVADGTLKQPQTSKNKNLALRILLSSFRLMYDIRYVFYQLFLTVAFYKHMKCKFYFIKIYKLHIKYVTL